MSTEFSAERIKAHIKGGLWREVLLFGSVDSTNERALRLSSERDLDSGVVIIADSQDKGRGRLGRKWVSPPGRNIYLSLLFRPGLRPADMPLLTILAGVSSASAVSRECGLTVSIKWPNDLMVSGRKLGGILTETRSGRVKMNAAVVGIGINVNGSRAELPEEIQAMATSVKEETGADHSREELIGGILNEFEDRYKLLLTEGRSALLNEWRTLSCTLGRQVVISMAEETLSGIAEEIDDEGLLLLRLPSGERRRISAGDLTILR